MATLPQTSVLADQIRQTRERQQQDFVSVLETVSAVNPDQFAKATQVERWSGVPADVLHQNADRLAQIEKATSYADVYQRFAKTARALADGKVAALAHDDLDSLTRIEDAASRTRFDDQTWAERNIIGPAAKWWQSRAQSSSASMAVDYQQELARFDEIDRAEAAGEVPLGTREQREQAGMYGLQYLGADAEQRRLIREQLTGGQALQAGEVAGNEQALRGFPQDPTATRAERLGGDAGATWQAITEEPSYLWRAGAESAPNMLESLLAGAVSGPAGAAATSFSMEQGAKRLDVLREAGVNLADPRAFLKALQDDDLMAEAERRASLKAAGVAGIDLLSFGLAGKLLAPVSVGGRALKQSTRELVSLGLQMPVQGALEAGGEATGQLLADGKIDGGEVLLEGLIGGVMSGADVATFAGGRVFDNLSKGLRDARNAKAGRAALDEMVDAAQTGKLKARDLESFRAVTEQQLKDGAVETVWIPVEKLQALNQSGVAVPALLEKVDGLSDQFAEAAARGGSVSMKTADYLTFFGEFHDQLGDSVRLQADGMSEADIQAWEDEQVTRLEALAQSMTRENDPVRQAYQDTVGQLVQSGWRRQDAEQVASVRAAVLTRLADGTGLSAEELLARDPLSIRAQAPDQVRAVPVDDLRIMLGRLRAGDVPQSRDMFGKSLVEQLTAEGGLVDAGGELAALDADVGKVGRNRLTRADGKTLDDAAMWAWERGYFDGYAREEVTPDLLVQAIRDEMAGNPRYSVEQENATLREQATQLGQLQDYLEQIGADLQKLSDDQVVELLRAPQGQRLNQGGMSAAELSDQLRGEFDGLKLDLMGRGQRVTLSRIVVPESSRSSGTGSKVMQRIIDWADASGVTVQLTPSSDFGGNKKRLLEFYKRFGFVENKGRNKDYEISEAMYREPQKVTRLNQPDGSMAGPERGSISFGERRGGVRAFDIRLTPQSDLSTVLHELGHYYLEVIGGLVADGKAGAALAADYATIRRWLGAEEGQALSVDQHEQFARGFEKYLGEGKAPSVELQGAFARFKSWLVGVYKDLARLNVQLSDEVRGVFDRLLASDEAIAEAEQVGQVAAMFDDAAKAGMSDAEWAAYQDSIAIARADATAELEQQVLREEERRRSKWWREELERIRAEVTEEVDLQPVYQAMRELRSGNLKLNSGEIRERYGLPATRKLSFLHGKKGLPMDVVAGMMGFQSGDQLVKEILGAAPRAEVIEQEAQARMRDRHGLKSTGEAAEEAQRAVHNDKRAEVLQRELDALGKQANKRVYSTQSIVKAAAERIMQERKVRDVQPYEYQRAEAKAGRDAFKAATKGDLEAAYQFKQQQVLNFHLYREAVKARDLVDTIVERMKGYSKTSKRQKLGKAGQSYLDQIDTVMEQYEFRAVSLRELDRRVSFSEWYDEQVKAGKDPYVPEFVLRSQGKTNYKDLSLAQLQELAEFVAHVDHLAKTKNELLANKRVKDLGEAKALLIGAMVDNLDAKPRRALNDSSREMTQVMRDWLAEGNSSLMKLEQIIEWLDGGDANGPWSSIFWQPLAEAQHQRDDLNKRVTVEVIKATNQWFNENGARAGQKVHIKSLGQAIDRNGILAVALNTGNASNLDKMLRGNKWDQSVVDEILGHMSEADWRYVVEMWRIVESLWPDIVALEQKVNGIAPEKIDGRKQMTPIGEVSGGYWPLVYDVLSPEYAQVLSNLGDLAPLNEQGGVRAGTPKGHTKQRVDGFAAPVLLDTTVIGHHLQGVIHDLTHRVALADARRLVTAPEVRAAMNQRLGEFQAAQFANLLDGIATDLSAGPAKGVGVFRRTMNALRSNAAVAWMGYSATTMLNQLGGYAQAMDYFAQKGGRREYLRAIARFAASPLQSRKLVLEMSGEMRNRDINLDPAIRQALEQVVRVKAGGPGDVLTSIRNGHDAIKRYAFVPMQAVQSLVDTPVWMAAYELEGGVDNHEAAVQAADRAVRLTQMAGGAKDLAPIQQNEVAKFFLLVYGYASLLWNRNVDIARTGAAAIKAKDAQGALVALERFVYLNILPSLLAGLIKGQLPDDEDDEDYSWPEYLAIQSLLSVSNGVPLARDAANGMFSDFGYGGISPLGGGIDSAIRATHSSKSEAIVTNMLSATGMLTGLPSSQANRAVRTFYALEDGELEADAATILQGMLFGPKKEK